MLCKNDLIASFHDTLTLSTTGELSDQTKRAVDTSKIYHEGFQSHAQVGDAECSIVVSANTTFAEAQKYVTAGRVAVLNFANPVNPGGGVVSGAMAQEECLCRSSNLYTCLRAGHLYDGYYGYHIKLNSHFYSDRLIYTRDVTVFKDDSLIPVKLSHQDWFHVDVITCAAPYLGGSKYTNPTVLTRLFQERITNIMEAALDNQVETIVLGAFGCGAFKNPARLVAEAFQSVIESKQYCKKFKNIVFAIKKESDKDFGENYCTFRQVLTLPLLENYPNYHLPEINLPTGKTIENATITFCRLPANTSIEAVKDLVAFREETPERLPYTGNFVGQRKFLKWQRTNPYYKKQISILGDSISTLEGYNPNGHNLFFKGEICARSGVSNMEDTWWGQVIRVLGAELLVNNSWSGSRVTQLPGSQTLFPSGCSDERTGNLHIRDVKPDVIIVYLGTNDWGYGVSPQPERTDVMDASIFSFAYDTMIKKLQANYPEAEICCCTLNTTYMSTKPDFTFPIAYGGVHIDEYNNVIRNAAYRFKCKLIDLAGYHKAYDAIDGSHPNAAGMKTLAVEMLRELDSHVSCILDCRHGEHQFVPVEQNTGDTKYVCSICCKVKHEGVLFHKKITKAYISYFNGDTGQVITLDGSMLTWRNTLAPRVFVCDYDCSEKKVELTDLDVMLLQNELNNVDLEKCVSDLIRDHSPKTRYNVLRYTYDDGTQFEYKTAYQPVPAFDAIKDILNKRCGTVGKLIPPPRNENDTVILKPPKANQDVNKLDLDITDILYSACLNLFVCSSQKTITLHKTSVKVGRGFQCDLNFAADKKYLSRRHATFQFHNSRWYLTDHHSKNGTCVNGIKLEPGKEHQLAANDEIVFAQHTKVVFNKTFLPPKPLVIPGASRFPQQQLAPVPLGTVIGEKYRLEQILVYGPRKVYLASVEGEEKKVAVKEENIYQCNNAKVIAHLKETFELHKVIKHPDVPAMIEMIQTPMYIYFVMEYIEGETLAKALRQCGPLEPKRAVRIGINIANILQSMHKLNPPIICRDVKPSNIMLSNETDVKMFDFDLAMRYHNDGRKDDVIVGTVGYVAPEQLQGHARPETDLYGLGKTLYDMLTEDCTKVFAPGASITDRNPKVTVELERIVEKCLETDYRKRYRNCDELIKDLDCFLNDEPTMPCIK